MDITQYMQEVGQHARSASRQMVMATLELKNAALLAIADQINRNRALLKEKNKEDLQRGRVNGLSDAMLDRLEFTDARLDQMIEGLEQVASLPDPVGQITDMSYRPSGIQVGRQRVPLGVIGIIYESRPNVTIEAASLCIKSGNATILRGGSEAIASNQALATCIKAALLQVGLPEYAVQIIQTTDRACVGHLITMSEYVDVIVPRGGKGLIERISAEAKVPVIKHLDGICHVYIDDEADPAKAIDVAINSKTHRYGVCNAMETLLVHVAVADIILPVLAQKYAEKQVELRGCAQTQSIIECQAALEEDWQTEYLAPILSIKIVADMQEAIEHINHYGSQHTDALISENYTKARLFLTAVDSSSVMINASTRFADGFEYGLGAEIGISTDKIHARGPVGLEGLTSQKYIVFGDGHIRT